ncbi:hypothetical protein ANCCEY_02167 [Ancylostoma ceylanicum]|uniref:Uncharacterized protein n=1 Tax=Ancylostoma ceylanicum TaxID=53326 RepID=A0A0D6MCE6_9BILA|nr:hypothetical protein ANCCEY_02167 [Ancylostoma ceylanicum]
MSGATSATQRLQPKRQTLDEAYAPPANFLEIEVVNPITHGVGKMRYTDYEIRLRFFISSPTFRFLNKKNPAFVADTAISIGSVENWRGIARVAGHPLAQNERSLHIFLQEPMIDRNYVPGKIRPT